VKPKPLKITPLVERQVEEEEPLQTKRDENGSSSYTSSAESSITTVRGKGKPLSESERAFFEPRFGSDFSKVRIHTGDEASVAARSVNALAYTMGSDVVFGNGQYRPGTEGGRRLLAHELAHTFQQTGAGPPEIWRKIGDGHDLTASRFAGDLVLEAVYDNERLLKSGDKGAAVRKLQQALIDAGFSLPRFGVDGNFGSETTAAVYDLQRASGLAGGMGKGFDGIVGPTTMGWLDQRFSAGPTPAGTTPGSTPGCSTIKTVNVDIVFLDGSTRNGLQDLDRASSIFNQCCVRFALSGGGTESPKRTQALLGGDNVLQINPKVGDRTAEEVAMFKGATANFNLSGRIRAFYVSSITPSSTPSGHTDAYSIPPFAATGSGAALSNMVVITNTASVRGLAHEIGHILLNKGNSAHQDMDPEYLMSPAGPTPGERITPDQCGTIFANA
jgi:peptidoglycan hydrolase-like protein with peptidoglycan-binding domain